jgi:hypothetical protein
MLDFRFFKSNKRKYSDSLVIAQLCSIPDRLTLLPKVIKSLLPQIDQLYIVLNGFEEIPDILNQFNNKKVFIRCSDNSMTDAEKFHNIEFRQGYLFTCDDDLEYPSNYVNYMISKIEEYKRKAIITLHGRTLMPRPITSFYNDKIEYYHFMQNVTEDHQVDIGGTGVTAWHSNTIKLSFDDFKTPSMADIWMAIQARKQDVKIIVAKHKKGFLKYLEPELCGKTIWGEESHNDSVQTKIINQNF